ncbi:glycosyltransferase family 4 protein [Ectothiorhodospiraceae bacterium 2226]|nr:glycosyltransferase family 4 protein [Ectothiorhodospiraceae bacterium 2226]
MTTDAVGGVWTYALELGALLGEAGVAVELAAMGPAPSAEQREAAGRIPGLRLHHRPYRLEWMEAPWEDVAQAGGWLRGLAEAHDVDLVHLNGYAHGALDWGRPAVVVAHSCVLSWWQAVKGESAPAEWTRYRAKVSAGLRGAQAVVAPTAAMLDALERYYGAFERRRRLRPGHAPRTRRVIHNGRDARLFHPRPKRPYVMAAGRLWDEAKNIAALAQVAPSLPWPVYVAGDTESPDGGTAPCAHLRTLGALPPVMLARWLGEAGIYALPARYEPFGLSALEAALSGCPLVLGDIPSLRELWSGAAHFVPPDDPAALAYTLTALMNDPAARVTMARAALVRAQRYSRAAMGAGYLRLYADLITTERKQACG